MATRDRRALNRRSPPARRVQPVQLSLVVRMDVVACVYLGRALGGFSAPKKAKMVCQYREVALCTSQTASCRDPRVQVSSVDVFPCLYVACRRDVDEVSLSLLTAGCRRKGGASRMVNRSSDGAASDDREASPPRTRPGRPARLSVNLGSGPAEALRELMASKGISATEAIRRAISVWRFIEDEQARGNRIAVIETSQGKQNIREVLFRME